ncbi:hypothetical protein [Streptomyces galbus]|uniref:Uncharacterized protein n=1 Tax=Streptomyces galbus TaxID=33898 RepID=A0ABX1IG30_STRGB|nr:hypothetical protein [Streptomyces galbus]NKQ24559.1 hypothetical protein [Streptomyces galbus]
MTQLLGRLPAPVRMSLTQSASTLASTPSPRSLRSQREWGDKPSADEVAVLNRFEH